MPIRIERIENGYWAEHRPINRPANTKMLPGPVFQRPDRALIYLQFGMGSGPWIIMRRDYLTGKAQRLRGSGQWDSSDDAVAGLRALASAKGWREVGTGDADFVCGRGE